MRVGCVPVPLKAPPHRKQPYPKSVLQEHERRHPAQTHWDRCRLTDVDQKWRRCTHAVVKNHSWLSSEGKPWSRQMSISRLFGSVEASADKFFLVKYSDGDRPKHRGLFVDQVQVYWKSQCAPPHAFFLAGTIDEIEITLVARERQVADSGKWGRYRACSSRRDIEREDSRTLETCCLQYASRERCVRNQTLEKCVLLIGGWEAVVKV